VRLLNSDDKKRNLGNAPENLLDELGTVFGQRIDPLAKELPLGEGALAKYRVITQHLRSLIVSGALKPDTRLPSIKALAKQWQTNYFTVHLALNPLANEGLIERSRGSRTFVRNPKTRLSCVGIYYGINLWTNTESAFYQRLYYELQMELEERGVRFRTFIDSRPPAQQFSPLPELSKAIEQREVQGIIGTMLSNAEKNWLVQLGLPVSLYASNQVQGDNEAMFDLALQRLAKEGCKTVGAITSNMDYALFAKQVSAHGMTTSLGWFKDRHANDHSFNQRGEEFGYAAFREIWAHQHRPEGLIVLPDWVCRGTIIAMLELGVTVPQHLRLVFYRNIGIDYLCPWKVPSIILDAKTVARFLADTLYLRHRTGQFDSTLPPFGYELVG